MIDKGNWYKLEDAEKLPPRAKNLLMRRYVNPGMVKLFGLLGFEEVWASSAEGMYITLNDGRRILDMTGGNGVLGLGHNHPRILSVREKIAREKRLEICKAFLSPYVAALAADISSLLPEDLDYSFFCNSGAEAVEGALKTAEKCYGGSRKGLIYTDHSFHGKTHAAMSVSSLDESRSYFQLLEQCYRVPYGSINAFKEMIEKHRQDVCAFIVEAIHGTRIIFPPEGYMREVRDICTKNEVVLILDEIYTGFGRTGYWFAFEAEGIVPDIVCYSKAFGGGKASIAGYTVRRPIFLRAYGSTKDCMMHSSTFSGMTEECATAIEALNIFKEEGLIEKSRKLGGYLGERLSALKIKYPERVNDVRGRGLLWGIELKPVFGLNRISKNIFSEDNQTLASLTGAIVLAALFGRYNLLAYLGFTRRNLIVFSPALIVNREELDKAVSVLEEVLKTPWPVLISSFLTKRTIKP